MDPSKPQQSFKKGTGPFKKGTGPLGVCPYLGVQDDPATHFAWAKPGHFCYRVRPSQPIEPSHQENFCLNGKYPTCVVYPASWRGPLPSKIRDDAYMDWIKRAAVVKSSLTAGVTGQGARAEEKNTSRFGMDLEILRDQAEFMEDEPVSAPRYRRLEGRKVFIGILAFLMVGLVLLAAVLSIQSLIRATSASNEQLGGEAGLTETSVALSLGPLSQTPVGVAVAILPSDTPAPTETPLPTSSWTPVPDTATPTWTPETSATLDLTAVMAAVATSTPFNCQEESSLTYEIVRGPVLVPEMGYVYSVSTAPDFASAGWIIRNTSPCTWENVLLLSLSSNRLLVPYIRQNGQLITENSTNQAVSVPAGGEIEVGLVFPLYMARSIRGEWAVVINNFRLLDKPHLELDVNNWVVGFSTAPTQPTVVQPPPPRDRGGDDPPSNRP